MQTTVMPTNQSENAYWPTCQLTCRSENHDAFCENCSWEEPKSKRPAGRFEQLKEIAIDYAFALRIAGLAGVRDA